VEEQCKREISRDSDSEGYGLMVVVALVITIMMVIRTSKRGDGSSERLVSWSGFTKDSSWGLAGSQEAQRASAVRSAPQGRSPWWRSHNAVHATASLRPFKYSNSQGGSPKSPDYEFTLGAMTEARKAPDSRLVFGNLPYGLDGLSNGRAVEHQVNEATRKRH